MRCFSQTSAGDLAPKTNDQAFLRRASLDLIGELPTPSEVTLFSAWTRAPTSDHDWSTGCWPIRGLAQLGRTVRTM